MTDGCDICGGDHGRAPMAINLPPIEEARGDLADIRAEIQAMDSIIKSARFLATRDDVDHFYYRRIASKAEIDRDRGAALERRILELYPDLK